MKILIALVFFIIVGCSSQIKESQSKKTMLKNQNDIEVYKMKKKHGIKLNEMWWNDKWPFNKKLLNAFDLIREIGGEELAEFESLFLDSASYEYEAITTLSPNYRVLFYDEHHDLYKEILLSLSPEGEGAVMITLPKKKEQGNKCWFMTKEASKILWTNIYGT